MLERVYLEIGNICNLSCSFCTGTNRQKRQMNADEFAHICSEIKGKVKFVYFHVLGEPLLHKNLDEFIKIDDLILSSKIYAEAIYELAK